MPTEESPLMRRPRYPLTATVVVGLVLAACASPAASEEPGASGGSEPSAAGEASQAGGDGGGGGTGGSGGIGMTLPDGAWSSGDLHVTISGDAGGSYDAPLLGQASATQGGQTILTYISAEGEVSIGVAIYTDSFAISVTTTELVAGGGTTTTCNVDYHTADDNNIDADFSCPDSPAFTAGGASGGTVDIEGSLTASR
ncbi:MAG: hypothetical protein ACRDFR_07890 [Candidatus Limnocylindria bacterium]